MPGHDLWSIAGCRIDLDAEKTVVGRGSSCDVVLDVSDISRQHTRILRTAGEVHEFRSRAEAIPVTISVGVAVLEGGDTKIDDLVAQAYARLYEAKGAGRNRVGSGRAHVVEG